MSTDKPSDYLSSHHGYTQQFRGDWDTLDSASIKLLHDICDRGGVEPKHAWSITVWDMDRAQIETGWRVCMLFMKAMVDLDYDVRDMRWYVIPRYPTLVRYKTHGFTPVPATGDPAIAQPHRPRAVNYGD